MAKNISVKLPDGTSHIYEDVPDDVTPEQITERVKSEYPDIDYEAGNIELSRSDPGEAPADEPGIVGGVTDTSDPLAFPGQENGPAIEAPHEMPGNLDAAWSGMKSGALMGFDDEISGLGGGVAGLIGALAGKDTNPIKGYTEARDRARADKQADYEGNTLAYGAGFLPGLITSAPATFMRGAQAETLLGRLLQSGQRGAEAGAASGLGNAEGDFGHQALATGVGAAIGAPMGVVAHPVASFLGNLIGRAVPKNASAAGRAETSGLDMLSQRAPQDANAMATRLDEMEAAGVPARLVDVIDESGRGVVRDSASKMTPARQEVATHANSVYVGAQDRVANQARRHIDPADDTARQLERQIRGDRNLGGDDEAGVLMGAEMDPIRGVVIQIDDGIKSVLSTREGRKALQMAEGLMTDPAERAMARKLMSASGKHAKMADAPPVDPDKFYRDNVPSWDKLPPQAQAQVKAQLPDPNPPQTDPFEGVTMTLDMADKFARAMKGRSAQTPGLERVATEFGNTVRNAARQQVPEYEEALTAYAASQGVADAAGGTGKFEGSDFLKTPADTYARQVEMASPEPAAVMGHNGGPPMPEDVPVPTVSEADALRRRARDDVVDAATTGGGQNAPRVARTLAHGSDETGQGARNAALLGEEGAENLQRSMREEGNRIDNTRFIDSRVGSKTQSAGRDAVVDGFLEAIPNAATGGKYGIAKLALQWLRKGGIRNVDAERLARLSISENPAHLREAIEYLTSKGMSRARSERFVTGMAASMAVRPFTQAPDGRRDPPNSVRSLIRNR